MVKNKGKLIEESDFYPDGSLEEKTIYTYNNKGILVKDMRYWWGTTLIEKNLYDNKGNIVDEFFSFELGSPWEFRLIFYY
jgi:hypothetical protein